MLSKKNHKPPMKWGGGGGERAEGEGAREGKNGKSRWKKRKRGERNTKEKRNKGRKGGRLESRIGGGKEKRRKERKGRVGVKETKRKSGCKKGSQRVGQFSLKISRRRGVSWKRELERLERKRDIG